MTRKEWIDMCTVSSSLSKEEAEKVFDDLVQRAQYANMRVEDFKQQLYMINKLTLNLPVDNKPKL
jgi:hypothetical protein